MERAEKAALGIAALGHVALFGLLSVGFLATPNPADLKSKPIEVSLADDIALESGSPTPEADPRQVEAPEEGPLELAATPPPPAPETPRVDPTPPPRVEPTPAPRPAERARPRPERPKAREEARPEPRRSRLDSSIVEDLRERTKAGRPRSSRISRDMIEGATDNVSRGRDTTPPGAAATPAVQAALAAEVVRQLRPHWRAPTGPDAEKLRTTVRVALNRNGGIIGTPEIVRQTGVTASNSAQKELHAERAIRAVQLAAPFNLPAEYYDTWKVLTPNFDRNLSQ
ncbi:cell envelope biogenesis protein TolA [Sphingomonas gilva]|uniref:Cell envelope biogenesis protein TolA n=1 Tax=Sphingomonas gilva TaxID=2305907 RepID=A0A396S5Y9_9SPHN|nr:TonB C-terminal domain-containing protein [Sphingomonas gilva]RHW18825.1 cell envelope biogenesis protein TolA [Sphingomonas gilva]